MSSASRREQQSSHQEPGPSVCGHAPSSSESSRSGVAETVKEKAQDLASSLGSRGEQLWDTTKQGASAVASTAESAWDEVSAFVSRHPFACLAAGTGVAFLLFHSLSETSGPSYSQSSWRDWFGSRDYPEQQRGYGYGWNRNRNYDYPEHRRYESGRSNYGQSGERVQSGGGEGATNTGGGSFTERAQEMASAAAQRAGDAWESTREGARQLASGVADRAGDAWETMGEWGRGYPLGTLLVGAALGFGLNELLRSQGILGTSRSQGATGR